MSNSSRGRRGQSLFGIPSGRGRGYARGRGRGQPRRGGRNRADQGLSDTKAFDIFFPDQDQSNARSSTANIEARYDSVREADEIDSKLGFARYQEGPTRLGWLVNMHATSVEDPSRNSTKAAVDYYFLEQDGGSFKCTLLYNPYFYIVCVPGTEAEVEEWIPRQFERFVESVSVISREDLRMPNHLTGRTRKLVKIEFRNVQDLMAVRREIQPLIKRNSGRTEIVQAYMDGGDNETRDVEELIVDMREYDVPYYLRVAIDRDIRVGHWYDVTADAGVVTLAKRDDLVARADPVVLAFDIETTKLPLKFPDASIDMIMMISYMIDGQGYLITNREIVSEDIEDFEYTPTAEFPGPFIIFNEPDEPAVIQRFFEHICDAKPTVLATYNGDSFDWPFVEARAKHHGIGMYQDVGWYRDESDEYKCRACVHMDCLRWVKRDSYLPVGSQGLKAVTTAKLGYNPMEIDPEDMTRFAAEQPQTLAQYSVSDAVATYYLYMKYVHPFIFSLCNIIPLNPDEVLRKGSGTLCETLLMVEAYTAGVVIPNKHVDPPEQSWDGHLIETETYVGGHVEALEAGVFRSDIPMRFQVDPKGPQRLLDELDRALKFSIEVEGKHKMEEIENYNEVRAQIAEKLEDMRDNPLRNETPLLYHLDVAAMYPNIILTNRLQPDAIVSESVCASCDFNVPGKTCDRRMPWLWRGEYFPPKRSEVNMLRAQLKGELFEPDGRSREGAPPRTYDQLSEADRAAELKKRVAEYSKKVYHRLRETKVEEREAMICQRENPFYVDTVRNFRDRRYVYKGLLKKEKRSLDNALAAADHAQIENAKKLVVLYDSLQLAHKCILNSFYGYVMRKGARWHSLEMAGVVCLTGSRIIQMARQRVEELGRPLELDTDGIWCALPGTFPENFSFKLKNGKGKFGVSYPCTMLNHLVFDKFTNHQYQDLVDPENFTYKTHSENSIFFEVDGPYRAMILPSSKEEDKLLKKRYAVFNDDGSLAELKGFEVKRRGELKLIKIFQSQIFKVFLDGSTLSECYAAVARVADQWLDILFSHAKGLPDHELFDLITENRSMSKALESYAGMKSTSICTARRLAEFLGSQMVKDKGLACKFVISKKPLGMPVSERAVPVAIFSADPSTKLQFLRRWLRDPALDSFDIRNILDWDYYLERFGSVIQKLITIPAAMQGVSNPVPRITHPDWLLKRVNALQNKHKQKHLTDMFKSIPKDEYMKSVDEQFAKSRANDSADIEDFGSSSADARVGKRGIVRKFGGSGKRKRAHANSYEPSTTDEILKAIGTLGMAPDPSENYSDWVAHSKKIWALKRKLREIRPREINNADIVDGLDTVINSESRINGDGLGQFFTRTHVSLARNIWHVLEWAETDTPGQLKAWVWIGGQIHAVRVDIPRSFYVSSSVELSENSKSKHFSMARSMILPRVAQQQQANYLYKCVMSESEYCENKSSWNSFFSHPSIGGVYETELTPMFRALIHLGATMWLTSSARRLGVGRNMNDVVSLDDLDTKRSSLSLPQGLGSQMLKSKDLKYALLYHSYAPDGRQYFALVVPVMARGYIWVIDTSQRSVQLQLPNLERLYQEGYASANKSTSNYGAFEYPQSIEFTSQAFSTIGGATRSINAALHKCSDEKKWPIVLICHSAYSVRHLRTMVRAINEFPTIPSPIHNVDRTLPHFDWQRHASKRMLSTLMNCAQWVAERVALAQYADVPVGNIPPDAPLFLADMFFARKLSLSKHVLWWSPGTKPDIGGRQDDEIVDASAVIGEISDSGRNASLSDFTSSIEISVPGSYNTTCVEIELKNLAVNTVLKAPLVNEIEGTVNVFGYDTMSSTGEQTSLLADDVAEETNGANRHLVRESKTNNNTKARLNTASNSSETDNGMSTWAIAASDETISSSVFQLLRSLLRAWDQESEENKNPFAEMMKEHFYRWLTRPNAMMHDPTLTKMVRTLMRKVFLQMKAECRKLDARIVYGALDKVIVTTSKGSFHAAQASVNYMIKAVLEKPLFDGLTLTPIQYWSHLLWMDSTNFGGIVVQDCTASIAAARNGGNASAADVQQDNDEPRIEMMWNIKDYLPPFVQSQFEVIIAEFIYKLASYYDQQRSSKGLHSVHSAIDLANSNDPIDDHGSDSEENENENSQNNTNDEGGALTKSLPETKSALANKAMFYKKLIGQYFTRKLLHQVSEIRETFLSAAHNDPNMQFPRLPGSRLYIKSSSNAENIVHPSDATLEFIKYVSAVFGLEAPAANFVRVMRRNLLSLLRIGEFSDEAIFVNPCERLVLSQVVCDYCNFCRNIDFCRDADLLPTQSVNEDGSILYTPADWRCLGCGNSYDRVRIEERLVDQLHSLLLSYQAQDVVCSKCRLMKQDNFSLQCASCAGEYKTVIPKKSVTSQIDVYLDVAKLNRLPMLVDLAAWAKSLM